MKKVAEATHKRHWLFWPLLFLVFFFLAYVYFFSTNGYFAYLNLLSYKEKVANQNKQLEKEKQLLIERMERLEQDSDALEQLTPVYLLYKDDVEVVKFYQETEDQSLDKLPPKHYDIAALQRVFFGLVSFLILTITFFFWSLDKKEHRS